MVLHDVPNDSELIKVPAASLGAEGLLKADHDGRDVIAVPSWPEDHVGKTQRHQILDHLLAQVVVNPRRKCINVTPKYRYSGQKGQLATGYADSSI